MSVTIAAHPDAIAALADDLIGLAAELSTEADASRRAGERMAVAVAGSVGSAASATGHSWAALLESLSQCAATWARALYTIALEYRAADVALAGELGEPQVTGASVAR